MSNNDLVNKLQALLLISNKPLRYKEIEDNLDIKQEDIKKTVAQLKDRMNQEDSGWWLMETNNSVQLATNPSLAEFIDNYLEVEQVAELTKPSLEALTVIAYCGPIGKMALDKIRGVNCALIIRNLLIKGLVEEIKEDGAIMYQVTMDFIKHLGLSDIKQLPDYEKLHRHEYLMDMMSDKSDSGSE